MKAGLPPIISNRTIKYTAIWKASYRNYTVTYDLGTAGSFKSAYGGGRYYSVSSTYPDFVEILDFDSLAKAEDNYNTYQITGWKDEKGVIWQPADASGIPNKIQGNKTFTAVYRPKAKIYTVSISAGGGSFADGTAADKVYTGTYGQKTNIKDLGIPCKDATDYYSYTFSAWSAALPDTFTENIRITANYTQSDRLYTISFHANGGQFADSATVYSKDYTYGSIIKPSEIPQPTRADDTYLSYRFDGWEYYGPLRPVTRDDSYYAAWKSTMKDASLPTGIFISDGVTTEDINSVNIGDAYTPIAGYQYELIASIPTLTVSGSGLWLSGSVDGGVSSSDDMVALAIASDVTEIGFDNLSLCSLDTYTDTIYSEGVPMIVRISGSCHLEKLGQANSCVYRSAWTNHRDISFIGVTEAAELKITAENAYGIFSYGSMSFDKVRLTMNVSGIIDDTATPPDGLARAFITGVDADIHFIDSNVSVKSPGSSFSSSISLSGSGDFDYISTDNFASMQIYKKLTFDNFTGRFHTAFSNPKLTNPIVQVKDAIRFTFNSLTEDPAIYGVKVAFFDNTEETGLSWDHYYAFVDSNNKALSDVTLKRMK